MPSREWAKVSPPCIRANTATTEGLKSGEQLAERKRLDEIVIGAVLKSLDPVFDADQNKITIKHGPIDNLGMPAMTLVFKADSAVVAKFKAGNLVRFKADRVDGSLKATELVGR